VNISPTDLFVRCALSAVGAQEVPAGSNAGMFVERCQKVTGGKKGDAWCCDFVSMIGKTALKENWPLPLTGSVAELAAFAQKNNVLDVVPKVGDLFVVWFDSLKRFSHVGVVLAVNVDGSIDSISGNTTDPVIHVDGASSREGWCVSHRPWHITPQDRFVRWVNLLPAGL
jgi:hypothetical protein